MLAKDTECSSTSLKVRHCGYLSSPLIAKVGTSVHESFVIRSLPDNPDICLLGQPKLLQAVPCRRCQKSDTAILPMSCSPRAKDTIDFHFDDSVSSWMLIMDHRGIGLKRVTGDDFLLATTGKWYFSTNVVRRFNSVALVPYCQCLLIKVCTSMLPLRMASRVAPCARQP